MKKNTGLIMIGCGVAMLLGTIFYSGSCGSYFDNPPANLKTIIIILITVFIGGWISVISGFILNKKINK